MDKCKGPVNFGVGNHMFYDVRDSVYFILLVLRIEATVKQVKVWVCVSCRGQGGELCKIDTFLNEANMSCFSY